MARRLLAATAMASCLAGLAGCGSAEPPNPTSKRTSGESAPAHAQSAKTACAATAVDANNPMLTPLTEADIGLYLSVMRAAAERVRHPTIADQAALQHQRQQEAAISATAPQREAAAQAAQTNNQAAMQKIMAAVNRGDYASAQATVAAANAHLPKLAPPPPAPAADFAIALDLEGGHADDLIVDQRHIDAQRYARIVDVVEYIVVPPQQEFMADGGGPMQGTPCPPTAQDRAIRAAQDRQRAFLQPYRDEIRSLEAVVRTVPPGQ